MNIKPYSMTAVIIYNSVAMLFCSNTIYSLCNIANAVSYNTGIYCSLKAFFCNLFKLANLRSNISNKNRMSCVAYVSVKVYSNIKAYKVSIANDSFFRRKTMNNFFVNTDAYSAREIFYISGRSSSV